jgi:hypothetical protein
VRVCSEFGQFSLSSRAAFVESLVGSLAVGACEFDVFAHSDIRTFGRATVALAVVSAG